MCDRGLYSFFPEKIINIRLIQINMNKNGKKEPEKEAWAAKRKLWGLLG